MKLLPFFVYGTLLPGQPNYELWSESIVQHQKAFFPNGRLYDLGAYPMLIEGSGGPIIGEFATISEPDYEKIMLRLDTLEGYDPQLPEASDYQRREREIHLASGNREIAWVYLGNELAAAEAILISSGDWAAYMVTKEQEIIEWWTQYRFGKME